MTCPKCSGKDVKVRRYPSRPGERLSYTCHCNDCGYTWSE